MDVRNLIEKNNFIKLLQGQLFNILYRRLYMLLMVISIPI